MSRFKRAPEIVLALAVIGVAVLLVAPIPSAGLDILLALNLAFASLVLAVSLSVKRPLSVSTFPAVLLIATLFRLGLNVSSTRLILSDAYAGEVIAGFASWVVAGSMIVGVVVFLILTVIQFVVIARGGERVAEVAARFALDAMPGRQLAIDADLRAGAIRLDEARQSRDALQRESRLYGAMDGAMKFVKGDAIAGLVIIAVDIVGGVLIGVREHGFTVGEALEVYGTLTIGDGLVTQIPALLLALGATLVVTRVASLSEENDANDLGADIGRELGGAPFPLAVVAVFLIVLGALPGLPAAPFLVLGVILGGLSYAMAQRQQTQTTSEPAWSAAERLVIRLPSTVRREIDPLVLVEDVRVTTGLLVPTPVFADTPSNGCVIEIDGYPTPAFAIDEGPWSEHVAARLCELAPALLSVQDTRSMVRETERNEPVLVRESLSRLSIFELTRVLRDLAEDGVRVASLARVLEAMLECDEACSHHDRVDAARRHLGPSICESLLQADRGVVAVGSRITRMLVSAVETGPLHLSASVQDEIATAVAGAAELDADVVAIEGRLRRALAIVLSESELSVVALEELAEGERLGLGVEIRGTVDIGRT